MRLILKTILRLTLIASLVLPISVGAETILHIPVPPEYLGAFASVPVVDRGVVAAANFAVKTRPVTLVEIVAAKQQLVKGKNIVLCLRVKNNSAGSPSRLVMAKVFKAANQPYQLKSWTRVNSCIFND